MSSRVMAPTENRIRLRTWTWEIGHSQAARKVNAARARIQRAGDQRMRAFPGAE
jgi:hypothetical protein